MKKISGFLSVVLVSMVAVLSAQAQDNQDNSEPRFKLSFSGVLAGPTQISTSDAEFNFRDWNGLDAWRHNFWLEYLIPHGAVDISNYSQASSTTLCCSMEGDPFEVHSSQFTGKVGDEYLMWAKRVPNAVREHGSPLGASLEYHAVGSLWSSFSFQMSRGTTVSYTDTAEFMRVANIGFVPCDNCLPSIPPTWIVESTRNRVVRDSEHDLRSFQFAVLTKYDLTRKDPYWSILPQVGADLLLTREQTSVDQADYQWKVFSGERHPSEWAHQPDETGSHQIKATDSRYQLNPVAGLSVELYPAKKRGHVAVTADGRYYFSRRQLSYEHPEIYLPTYEYGTATQKWTFSLGIVAKF